MFSTQNFPDIPGKETNQFFDDVIFGEGNSVSKNLVILNRLIFMNMKIFINAYYK